MSPALISRVEAPLGRVLSSLGKGYLNLLRSKLQHLDIDRNYYALVLIENLEGEITQQELAVLLDTDKVSVVRVVDYLSEKGYVKRVRKTDDHRKFSLVLTPKARAAVPVIKKSISELNKLVLKGLDGSKVSELTEIVRKIKSNLTENNQAI